MAIGFGSYFGGVAEGQQFREQQDLRERDQALREQEAARRALEADQMRQMREFQIKNAADEQKMREDLAAIPTTYDAPRQSLTAENIRALSRNKDGSYFTPEQAAAFRQGILEDPTTASEALNKLVALNPNASKQKYSVTAGPDGNLSYGATGLQRSQADIARDQARIMMRRGDPMSALTAQQLVINAHKADRDLIDKRMGEIMSMPLPDQEKANMMARFLTETSGIPGNFRMLPAEGGKKFALQYVDPATGEVRTDQKPRTLDDIYRDTIKHYSLENYAKVFDLSRREALLPGEVKKGEAEARTAAATATVNEGTVGPKIQAASLENRQTEARTNLLNSQAGYYDDYAAYLRAGGKNGKANMTPRKMSVRVLRENGKYEPVDVMVSSKDGELTYTRADGSALSASERKAVDAAWGQQSELAAIDERFTLDRAAVRKQLESPNVNYDEVRKIEAQIEQRREDSVARVYFKGLPTPELRAEALADSILSSGRNPNDLVAALGATTKEYEAAKKIIADRAKGATAPASAVPATTTPAPASQPPAVTRREPPSALPGGGKDSFRRTGEADAEARKRAEDARTQEKITRTGFDVGMWMHKKMPVGTESERLQKGENARRLIDLYDHKAGALTPEQREFFYRTLVSDVDKYLK